MCIYIYIVENLPSRNKKIFFNIKTSIEKVIGKFLDYLVRMWNKEHREEATNVAKWAAVVAHCAGDHPRYKRLKKKEKISYNISSIF